MLLSFSLAEADIGSFPIDKKGDQFIIIATDGLWDVFTSEEVRWWYDKLFSIPVTAYCCCCLVVAAVNYTLISSPNETPTPHAHDGDYTNPVLYVVSIFFLGSAVCSYSHGRGTRGTRAGRECKT